MQTLLPEPIRAPALFDVRQDGPAVKSARDRDLQGLGYLKSEMAKAVLEEKRTVQRIREARKKMDELNTDTDKTQSEVFAQKVIRLNLLDQKDYLGDARINWDEQLNTLERRRAQLSARLDEVGGAPLKSGQSNER